MSVSDEVRGHPALRYFILEAAEGMQVSRFRLGPDRLGEIVVTGDTLDEARSLLDCLLKKIDIVVR